MRPSISEFSYGFAVTSEFVQAPGGVTAAPVFPSLIAEGQPGGGWDVRVDRPGVPLFLQFKLCDVMTRRTCKEARQAGFGVPCFRMHLRSSRRSRQHEMLLDLESTGQEVYYCAPMFHRPEDLNDAFLEGAVRDRSVWIRPSDVGPLPDDGDHHVSIEAGRQWMFFSEPKPLEARRGFRDVSNGLTERLRERGRVDVSRQNLEALAAALAGIAEKQRDFSDRQRDAARRVMQPTGPLQRAAYYASVFLESQLFMVQERQPVA